MNRLLILRWRTGRILTSFVRAIPRSGVLYFLRQNLPDSFASDLLSRRTTAALRAGCSINVEAGRQPNGIRLIQLIRLIRKSEDQEMTNSLPAVKWGFQDPTTPKFMTNVGLLFCLTYLMAWIDKGNIGYAKLQMMGDLQLGEAAFSLGASIFFIGYILVDLVIIFLLPRVKAPHLLAILLMGIGSITMLLGLTRGPAMFTTLRFLLGIFEGGVVPALMFYVTAWTPYGDRSRVTGLILGLGLAANVVSGVICGALLDLDGLAGLRGWQWLFFMTGLPSILMSFVVLLRVPSGPEHATFYTPTEKAELARTLHAERAAMDSNANVLAWAVLRDSRVWQMMALLAFAAAGTYGLSYWLPTVIKQFGVSNTVNGFLSSLPWLLGILTMQWLPALAERHGREGLWMLGLGLAGALAFALMVFTQNNLVHYLLICIGAIGMLAMQPLYLIMPSRFLQGHALAAALPLMGLMGNVGGFFSQNAVAQIGAAYGATSGLLVISGVTVLTALLAWQCDRSTSRASTVVPEVAPKPSLSQAVP
jgi:sugar phosphate permease